MADFWTEEREDELVNMWEMRPCLFDPTLKSHSNRNTVYKAKAEIAQALGTTGKLEK